jgi:spore coat polysaccharide biosynthesis predicted glycosyltransferase SpsG
MGAFDFKPAFAVKHYTDSSLSMLNKIGVPFLVIPPNASWMEEAHLLKEIVPCMPAALILDFCHSYTLGNLKGFETYTKYLHDTFRVVTLFDGLANDALINITSPEVDLVVTPYCGAENRSGDRGFDHLAGPSFIIFQEQYAKMRDTNRPISVSGKKILITFGGSDPQHLTLLALQALSLITEKELEIRVIIGPAFKDKLKIKIKEEKKRLNCQVILLESPPSLSYEMLWCDIAISSTGLTKYELALTGTPAIFLSIDEKHHAANRKFSHASTGVDLGICQGITPGELKKVVLLLLEDERSRYTMSRNGLHLVNLHGADKILLHIRRLYDA